MHEPEYLIVDEEKYTPDNPKEKTYHLYIPPEIWMDFTLTMSQKGLLAYILVLQTKKGQCYASNRRFAKYMGVTERTISNEIRKLVDRDYIKINKFDGRIRYMIVNEHRKFFYADTKNRLININKHNNNSFTKVKENRFVPKRIARSKKTPIKKKRRVIKIKPVDKNITRLIGCWNTLQQPFAKVVKREPVGEVLQKVLKDNKPVEIESIFNIAHSYFNNPYFIFAGSKIRCHDFLVNNQYGFMGKWVKENKFTNWFEVFLIKGDRWLDLNLLKQPKDTKKYSKELYNSIAQVLQTNPTSRDDQIIIKRIANRMESWLSLNNTQDYQWPLVDDFQYYLREKHSDLRKVKNEWFVSRNFWNKSFNEYLVKIGRFEHINQIKRI